MGADEVIDPGETSPYESWRAAATIIGGEEKLPPWKKGPLLRQAVIFECVGIPGVINQIMERAPKAARIVVVGVCMQNDSFDPIFGINKELNIQFVLGYSGKEFSRSLQSIANGDIDVAPLITGLIRIDDVAQAFVDLGSPDHHAKILVEPWRT
jgi:threonine dehydrogenase-like Zn-dependent dehydrogenase